MTQWQLEIDVTTRSNAAPPPGISLRPFRSGDEQATFQLTEDAFMQWQARRRSYAEWSRLTIGRETFAPGLSPLAFDGSRLVGAVLSLDRPGGQGHIVRVAVERAYRRRGIAQALLRQAFGDFARAGKRSCGLVTHSGTGARGVYEKVGMRVTHSATHVRRKLPRERFL